MQMIKIAFSFEYIYFLKGIYLLFYFLFQLILSGYALLYIPKVFLTSIESVS